MFPFQSKPSSRPTFEDVFFEHRIRLYEWALQLTGRNHAEAEDLVQELYIRLARVGPIPEHIENAENYLFSTLRNLYHRLLQRARTSAIDDLSIVDYDSAEHTLRAVDRNKIFFIREDLHRVCDYLCERRNASRSASIFILRYFLGYYPSEVALVVQSTRAAVDVAIRAARSEARLDLERPGVLQQIVGRERKSRTPKEADDSHGLFLALRSKIFRSCIGECFTQSVLKAKYEQPGEGFSTAELAHLVSCPGCLDAANRILGLPLLEERSPDETIGRDTPQGPNGSSGAVPTLVSSRPKRKSQDPQRMRKRMQRRLEEVNQHRPQRLSIAVDGDIRASQKVTAQLSELLAELRPTEKPAFIEVLSEQSVCLAFVLVEALAPETGLQQSREIELSDGRTMTVSISFALESPTVQIVYSDPVVESDTALEYGEANASLSNSSKGLETRALFPSWNTGVDNVPTRFWDRIQRALPFNMNPLLASAMLFGICSLVCFLLWTRSGPRISAGTLLNRAEQSDVTVVQSARSEVLYQKVRITTSGHATERAIYRDPQKKRRPKQQHLSPDDQWLKDKLNLAGVNWDEPLSANNYREWHDRQRLKQDVVTRKGGNLLTLTTSADEGGLVLKESLTVRESDFHPVDRTIELRDMGTVEIAELNYDVMPWGAVNQDWFEPLTGQAIGDVPAMHRAIHLPHILSDLELDEAELAVRAALNQLHADTGEPIHINRTSSGIEIKGVVDTNTRRNELVSRLALLPNVHSSILSAEEIGARPLSQTTNEAGPPIQVHSVEAQPSPLEQYLSEKKLQTDQLPTISHELLDGSLRINQAGVHLSELEPRFNEADQLPTDMQNQLITLSHNYIATIETGLNENKRTLLSLGFDSANQPTKSEVSESDRDIAEEIRHYRQLYLELILNGTGQPRPATEIAKELMDADERIRLHLARISATVPGKHN